MKTKTSKQNIGKTITFLISLLVMYSCTEVIEFDLKDVTPQLVVEASVPESGYAEVVLTTTVNVNSKNESNHVTGAIVVLEDETGHNEILEEVSLGHYQSKLIIGVPNASYKLRIAVDQQVKEISSEDTMPLPIKISRLRVRESNMPDVNGLPVPAWEVIVDYNDPINEKNYYRFVEYINGKISAHYVETDIPNNGVKNKSFLTSCTRMLVPGDTLTVEMQSISKAVYDYFYGFSLLNKITQGTTVVNPVTNVSGVKLGYFSAHTVSRKSIVVQ